MHCVSGTVCGSESAARTQNDVHLYVPSPRRCFKCQKFGHNTRVCRAREEVCQTCATPGHSKDTCPNSDNPKCLNYKRSHTASDRDCPRFVAEKAALQIQAESHCSLVDARKKVEQTSASTNKEPDSASTPEQRNSYARTVAFNQADLLNRNLTLSEENARLREIISTLRKDNASLQQRLDGYEKRLSNLEKSRVVDAHPDTSTDGVQTNTPSPVGSTHNPNNTISVGSAHNPTPVGDAHNPANVGDAHTHPGPTASVSSLQLHKAKCPTDAPSYIYNVLILRRRWG